MMLFHPKHTFKTFVVGLSNELAHARIETFRHKPDTRGRFVYLYGHKGLGKTHLLHALGNHLIEKTTWHDEIFLVSLAAMPEHQTVQSILDHVRYLFVDDFQHANDDQQALFVDWIEAILASEGNVILASQIAPNDQHWQCASLKSLFGRSESADIQPPEEELRIAIIDQVAEEEKVTLPKDARDFLVTNFPDDIGRLIGAFKRVKTFSMLNHGEITFLSTLRALHDFIWPSERGEIVSPRK